MNLCGLRFFFLCPEEDPETLNFFKISFAFSGPRAVYIVKGSFQNPDDEKNQEGKGERQMTKANVIEEKDLMKLARAARGKVQRIYLHWSGGHYGANEDAYHLCIDKDGQVYVNCAGLGEKKAHTWLRNSNSVAVSLLCCHDGTCWPPGNGNVRTIRAVYAGDGSAGPDDAVIRFGDEPPTETQIEVMAKLVALLCEELGLVIDKDNVQTHCEIAFKDHYGPGSGDPYSKWDLWFLPDYRHNGVLVPGGALLRGKALFYRNEMRRSA